MTLGDQATYAERLARTASNALTITNSSDVTKKYVNEGTRELAKKVGGIPKEDYLQLVPRFDSKTWWAIRVTITGGVGCTNALAATDVAITATNRANATGATVASDLQTAIQAVTTSTTVVFNTSGSDIWKFTIDSIDGTDIEINSPSGINYSDATDVLFAKTGTSGAQTWVSNLPQDTFVETDLPSNFLRLTHVEWDGIPLREAPWGLFISPETHGTPTHYAIKNKKIRVYPAPSSQDMFHVWYNGVETDLAVDGTADSTDCPLPTEVHMGPVYFAASKLCEENHEFQKSILFMRDFLDSAIEYRLRESNANPALEPSPETVYRPPEVISST